MKTENWNSFDDCIKNLFGRRVHKKIKDAIWKGSDAPKHKKIMVSYDDLIEIWNFGVTNGVEGMKEKYNLSEKN